MEPAELVGALEALLFAAPGPVAAEDLAAALGVEIELVRLGLEALTGEYRRPGRGIQLTVVAGGYRLFTRPQYHAYIKELLSPEVPRLTRAALETLAVVAYRQPVTRAEVEAVRGVKSDATLRTLLERGLIEEKGRKEALGRPILFGTTPGFLEYFGLADLDSLPALEEPADLPDPLPSPSDAILNP